MNLVFFGSGAFGLPTLIDLARTHSVVAVVSQPDRPAGRGGQPTPTPVSAWARGAGLPVLTPERVNDPREVARIRALGADAWVVIAFGQKLGKPLLAGVFAINLHASLLPRWRGAAPINAAILAGDAQTGNSVITLADRMDAGEVLAQSRRAIEPAMTAGELHDALSTDGPALVQAVLARYVAGTLEPAVQEEAAATMARKLSRSDGWVDFAQGAEECRRRVHGLTPWPGVTVKLRDQPVKLLRVQPAGADDESPGMPGTIVDPNEGLIACGRGLLRVLEVQPAGGRAMAWGDFARGRRVLAGERFVGGAGAC